MKVFGKTWSHWFMKLSKDLSRPQGQNVYCKHNWKHVGTDEDLEEHIFKCMKCGTTKRIKY